MMIDSSYKIMYYVKFVLDCMLLAIIMAGCGSIICNLVELEFSMHARGLRIAVSIKQG